MISLRDFGAYIALLWCLHPTLAAERIPFLTSTPTGLAYEQSPNGDRIPDFSYSGYNGGDTSPPQVTTRITVDPSGLDDTVSIQAAIDQVAAVSVDRTGWRGAVQLSPGRYEVNGTLFLRGNKIVLRGAGLDAAGTTIVASGRSRRPLIVIGGVIEPRANDSARRISRIVQYVPVGSMTIHIDEGNRWRVGQRVHIEHTSSEKWIANVGMNSFPNDDGKGSWLDWKPGTMDQSWERTILAIDNNEIKLDAPITSAIDPEISNATVVQSRIERRSEHLGIENLRLISEADTSTNPKDEEHAWDAIRFNDVTDAWARSIACQHFVGSAVHVGRRAQRVSVVDCESKEPISENAGWRRHTFYTLGQQTLFLRCRTEDGRHDFSVGPLTSGPNAFVHCSSRRATDFSGPIGSWATGVLYDNIEIDGAGLSLTNRETAAQGTGWSAANCVLWNCVAPTITCRKPPTAYNWAIGIWGEVAGDGAWRQLNVFTSPESLYETQLIDRIGAVNAERVMTPARYSDVDNSIASHADAIQSNMPSKSNSAQEIKTRLRLQNGWLVIGDRLAIGSRLTQSWWRGSVLPAKVKEFGSNLTRFVPGCDEPYYTDDVADITRQMRKKHAIVLEHHWGLWYDRRRDDHQMIRRIDGDVWPPFYEQPWARSGQGKAWDGLSRYDLTKFNTWYFDRLREFAEQADKHELVLMQYMYFQHNILEAGAHWADFPWRPANCLQDTGFPEPPTYENRKRIFMADAFYDVSHPVRRDMHTRYIRHCLDSLGHFSNVLFVLGEEFTGPEHFVRFWLDTIRQWEIDTGRNVMVVLSATRDVQDAILANAKYASQVDVIDLKYWWYTPDGSVYDPPGGQNLAPRQQLREWKGSKNRGPESLSRAVCEMRSRFPDKAILCSLSGADPWQLLAAGGSIPELPADTNPQLLSEIVKCQPTEFESGYSLRHEKAACLIVSNQSMSPDGCVPIDRRTGQPVTDLSQDTQSVRNVFWKRVD